MFKPRNTFKLTEFFSYNIVLREKIYRMYKPWLPMNSGLRLRLGFSLIEVGLAIVVVSTVLVVGISSTLSALNLQLEADRLALAMSLVQTKMAELRSQPDLTPTDSSGEINDENDIHFGYRWTTYVREENLNLSKALELENEKDALESDFLPNSVQNQANEQNEGGGASDGLFSLGDIPVLRITVKVEYPKGGGSYGKYSVETIQSSQSASIYQRQ